MYKLFLGDCIDVMDTIPDNSIDMVLADLPFNTTPCYWDRLIPHRELWKCYHRICKPNSAIVLFGQEPFSSHLRLSNEKEYRYDWYWEKERLTNVFQVKRRCGKTIENIMVFYKEQPIYNPQKHKHTGRLVTNKIGDNARFSETQAGKIKTKPLEYHDDGTRHPTQLLRFSRDNPRERLHPTQKPIALLEYLIKTYTNEDMTVLDNCMGSGSTIIAALNTDRNCIGIEKDKKYFEIAKGRIESHENGKVY